MSWFAKGEIGKSKMEIRKEKLEEAGGTRPSAGRPRHRKEGKKGAALLRPYKGMGGRMPELGEIAVALQRRVRQGER